VIDELRVFVAEHAEWFLAGSIGGMIIGAVLTPILVTRIPPDYFLHRRRHPEGHRYSLLNLVLGGVKNVIGAVFVVTGILLLVLPGQGLITLLLGLMIMNYPGKFALERWFIRRPHVLPSLNWLRSRCNHPPLESP